jgi:undecaprenyl-diphosphatase
MDYLYAALLGLLQGLTEFLPVSSSGHLVIAQHALGLNDPAGLLNSLAFDIVLHLGTLLAVLVYFRARIMALVRSIVDRDMIEERRMIGFVIVGTLPAVAAGLFIKSQLGGVYHSATFASAMLLVTGAMLLSTGLIKVGVEKTTLKSGLWIGVAQALAILPGISRSGATISMGMFLKVDPKKAAEFSFLLAIPAILGAAVLELRDFEGISTENIGVFLVGSAVAFVSGLAAVGWLMRLIGKGQFKYFGFYCLLIGSVSLLLA